MFTANKCLINYFPVSISWKVGFPFNTKFMHRYSIFTFFLISSPKIRSTTLSTHILVNLYYFKQRFDITLSFTSACVCYTTPITAKLSIDNTSERGDFQRKCDKASYCTGKDQFVFVLTSLGGTRSTSSGEHIVW